MWINMGPQHPMTHGLGNLRVLVDGETIADAKPEIGYLHRGIEKLAEHRTYTQIIPLCDRLGYASAMTWSHLYCLSVEVSKSLRCHLLGYVVCFFLTILDSIQIR